MTVAAEPPQPDPFIAAAYELQTKHRATGRPPRAVPAWASLSSLPGWLEGLRTCCLTAAPESAKAAEWLLDNHHQLRRAIRQVGEDMPASFYRRLPRLTSPQEEEGRPRVYALAHGMLAASHLQLSLSAAADFVRAYEEGAPLTIAELWAFPTMLRLVCLEVVVGASTKVFACPAPFEETAIADALESLDVTERISRALVALQAIAAIPWKEFFDRTSLVEATLQRDPADIYARMDFDTRDRYRKAVEDLAAGAADEQADVAERALALAREEASHPRRGHVGYWLVDEGRRRLEAEIGFRAPLADAAVRWLLRHPGPSYAAALAIVGVLALVAPSLYLWAIGATPPVWAAGILASLVPASIVAVTIVHWLVTLVIPPRVHPKLDFETGIPPDFRTAIVVPVIMRNAAEVPAALERLEMHWIANPDPSLQYALLSDLADAPTERTPNDASTEQALVDGVRRLNARHGTDGRGPFHLLHRARRYNPAEGCWMGWERKRGKLEQLNQLLLGGGADAFPVREGDLDALRGVRFVVTVDADTALPAGAVPRLVGAMAHPLNRAEMDPSTRRLLAGYTVIQPRVEISPESGGRSLFARLYAGDTAIDIYSRAVSDVYQDLFSSAVYVGKGIYDVEAFHLSLEGQIPENTVLSHDLLEGAHGRVALASDIVIYDAFPTSYLEYARRWRRWVRGDWQLLPWLCGRAAARLPALDRWRIFDNLRRSLLPLALVAFAVTGWLVLPRAAWVWTALTVGAPGAYLFTDLIAGLTRSRRFGVVPGNLRQLAGHAGRWALAIVFLLNDAVISLDAAGRTLWRMFVSRRHLLEWTSAAHTAATLGSGASRSMVWRAMWPSSALAAAMTLALAAIDRAALPAALPLLLLWLAAPEIASWVSRPRPPRVEQLTPSERVFLRRIARRTWLFFETLVGPEDHWLPPDNLQEDPHGEIAHRTSPTNIGMMLVSSLTAWDLGYLSSPGLALRVQNALDTLDRLERYRGHILNWLDTRTLTPLEPRYVSTVDSGNLAVCLVTLKEGCLQAARAPAIPATRWDGLVDTLGLLADALEDLRGEDGEDLDAMLDALFERFVQVRDDPGAWRAALAELADERWPALEKAIVGAIAGRDREGTTADLREIRTWVERTGHQLQRMQTNLDLYFPWLAVLEAPAPGCEDLARELAEALTPAMTLEQAPQRCQEALRRLSAFGFATTPDGGQTQWRAALAAAVEQGARAQNELRQRFLDNAARAEAAAFAMDFTLLYDREARLFHIGYNVSSDRLDPHHYDLLASEARLASYFAIAKRDVPAEHWSVLSRPISREDGELSLLSWNGSMFEYLMPSLVMRSVPGNLLEQGERAAVTAQRRYADKLGVPWGISESGFAERDASLHYQYRAFGVPGLGLKRGLSRDLVIAPYASALALAVAPSTAARNLQALARLGLVERFGFIEAADFTPERTPPDRAFTPVRSYMAHHQGMILAAIGNALVDDALVARFSADMRMRAVDLLLQERIPWEAPREHAIAEEPAETDLPHAAAPPPHSWTPEPAETFPQFHMLGNARFGSWVSEAGGGALWWRRHALTRWLPDGACDGHGLWIYLQDEESGALWSAGRQPTGATAADAHVVFHPHMVELHRRDDGIATRMEIAVPPSDDLEIRRITLVNESDRPRALRVTSYGEVVLAPPLDDERHPAFSKLFVGAERLQALNGLLFTRRPRSAAEQPPALLHRLVLDELDANETSFEASRAAFLGRNGDARRPRGAIETLSGTTGWTLDPIMALQLRLVLEPRERRQLAFLTIASGSPESVLEVAERYATPASLDWALDDARREAAREAQQLALAPDAPAHAQLLASLLITPQRALCAPASLIAENRLGQPRLWALGISGDLPILLLRMNDPRESSLLDVLIRAHQLWRRRLFHVDLVILRTGASGYQEPTRERVLELVRAAGAHDLLGHKGGIHLVFADQISAQDKDLLEAAANVILDEARGPLPRQLAAALEARPHPPPFGPARPAPMEGGEPLARPRALLFDNGVGGFTEDGREYVVHLEPGQRTPAPWCNVLANDAFGTVVTESGGGFTWAINSGENRLTTWTNDPVADPPSEALYLRDEETAEIWTPTPAPAGAEAAHQIRHGAGYTTWRTRSHGLEHELLVFTAPDDPVKLARLRLRNLTTRARRLTATYYAEWLLGAMRSIARRHVVGEYDAASHALLARNPWSPELGDRVAFLTASLPPHSVTTDRTDFLGREGGLDRPAGLLRWDLGGSAAPGGDPCAAFQVHLDLEAEGRAEVVFALGQGEDRAHAEALIARWRDAERVDQALDAVRSTWEARLGAIEVDTPDPAFDLMVNRWLLYQSLSSRIMARAGFYQAGGAIGFRDQLQDVLAFLHSEPDRARAHILACAGRQFEEGDVLHWWHPPKGRGVRTRCSDDLLWLPYVTSRYVEATGDLSILSEEAPFLRAPPLSDDEEDRYALFEAGDERGALLEHCRRALERGLTGGPHGLPLIGAGDWNDGMNHVGRRGRGESIWLAWFTIATAEGFADLAARVDRDDLADAWLRRADDLRRAVERSGWDGDWYVRAFDDDGRPWGARSSEECRIDSIAQSWAVLSGAGDPERARSAVAAAVRELVDEEARLARLLTPPFHDTPRDPGYIKAYPPGIRENGGQYSHAAAWLGFALARLGDGDGALAVFDMISPVRRAASPTDAARYRTEPYVVAADIASVAPHTGRGGWSWYTGAAAWTWRLGVEEILGLKRRDGAISIDPCLPKAWGWARATIRGPSGSLLIEIEDPERIGRGHVEMTVDGKPVEGARVAFPTNRKTRRVRVRLRPSVLQAAPVTGRS